MPQAIDGRFFFHKGIMINCPRDIYLPRCTKCKKDQVDDALRMVLDEVLDAEFRVHEKMIEEARERLKTRPGTN